MINVPIFDREGKTLAQKEIQTGGKISHHAIKAAVLAFQTNQRQGTASTKTRAEVSGSGKKPWKQKGTGRARSGERTSPVWRGGGIVFGPRPHDYHYRVNQQVLRLARDSALQLKLKEGKVILVRDFKFEEPRTKLAARVLKNLKLEGKTLVIVKDADSNMHLALRNLPQVDMIRFSDLNAYEILTHQHIVFTEEAFEGLSMKMEAES
jgi:large subunit ribosomal protein L4